MKLRITLSFLVLIFNGKFSFAQDNDCVRKFEWLAGTWKMDDKDHSVIEEWTPGGKGSIKCRSYEVKGADTNLIERASIGCIAGKQVFTYYPVVIDPGTNRMPVSFALVSEDNNTYIFENTSHDFPQRVVYQMVNAKECHAWIEGDEKGKKTRIDFHYKKVLEPLQNQ